MTLGRRSLLGAGLTGLLGAATLTGCTAETQPWDDLGAEPLALSDEVTWDLTEIPAASRMPLETPEASYQVTAHRLTGSLFPGEVEVITGSRPEEPVPAPPGEAFLLVRLQADFRPWPFASLDASEATTLELSVRRPGSEEPSRLELPDPTLGAPLLLRVAADAAPEDVVLQATSLGAVQQLSLLDGSRLRSDIEHIYGRMRTVGYSATPLVRVLQAEQAAADGAQDALDLDITQIVLTPLVPALGWPGDGLQMLGAEVAPQQRFTRSDGAMIALPATVSGRLDLPDGTAVDAVDVASTGAVYASGQFSRESFLLWFPVPVDLAAAALHLDVQPFPRTEGLAGALGIEAGAQRALTFAADAGES
ncbi:hypothetical protein [Brachybacterium phenoliresistens]|uniref:hypothetical protein n=1 Tax=Brachybacterium phenoliresistens TaxID=396014 RepID=UPI0031D08431